MNRSSGFFSRWFVRRRPSRRTALYPYTDHPAFNSESTQYASESTQYAEERPRASHSKASGSDASRDG